MKIDDIINDAKQICDCDCNSKHEIGSIRNRIIREIDGLMPAYGEGEQYIDDYIEILIKTKDFYENRLKELE